VRQPHASGQAADASGERDEREIARVEARLGKRVLAGARAQPFERRRSLRLALGGEDLGGDAGGREGALHGVSAQARGDRDAGRDSSKHALGLLRGRERSERGQRGAGAPDRERDDRPRCHVRQRDRHDVTPPDATLREPGGERG